MTDKNAPSRKPDRAFVLAAGHGTRMRPLTDTLPKPMVSVGGKPLIDHILEKLGTEGVSEVIINTHHLYEVIEKHLKAISRPRIKISREADKILDTGGGVKKALPLIGGDVFYHINGDAFWTESPAAGPSALARLAAAWDDSKMDILLLLIPVEKMIVTEGVGDYNLMPDGRAVRSQNKTGQYMFTGIRLTHPRVFNGVQGDVFSFLGQMDAAEKSGRLYAIIHEGAWHHISTPQDVEAINRHLNNTVKVS